MNKEYNSCVEGCSLPSSPNDLKILLNNIKREVDELVKTTEAKLLYHDGKIAELTKYIKDNLSNSIRCLLDSMKLSGELDELIINAISNDLDLLNDCFVFPEKYGAIGDGIHDDTIALRKALEHGKHIILNGNYLIDVNKDGYGIELKSNQTLELNGVIKIKPTNLNAYQIIRMYHVNNIKLTGTGEIIGDLDTHTGQAGEYGHCIMVSGCENILIENIKTSKGWGDGIAISNEINSTYPNKNIKINNVVCDNNRRLGLSIVEGQCIVTNSIFSNTKGTNPEAGFDIEPNSNVKIDVTMDNIICDNNAKGFYISNYNSDDFKVHIGKVKCKNSVGSIITTKDSDILIDEYICDSNLPYGINISNQVGKVFINTVKIHLRHNQTTNYTVFYSEGCNVDISKCYVTGVVNDRLVGNNSKINILIDNLFMYDRTYADAIILLANLTINHLHSNDLILKNDSIFSLPNYRNVFIFDSSLNTTRNANIGNVDKQYNNRVVEVYNNSSYVQRFGIPNGEQKIVTPNGKQNLISLNSGGYAKLQFKRSTGLFYLIEYGNIQ